MGKREDNKHERSEKIIAFVIGSIIAISLIGWFALGGATSSAYADLHQVSSVPATPSPQVSQNNPSSSPSPKPSVKVGWKAPPLKIAVYQQGEMLLGDQVVSTFKTSLQYSTLSPQSTLKVQYSATTLIYHLMVLLTGNETYTLRGTLKWACSLSTTFSTLNGPVSWKGPYFEGSQTISVEGHGGIPKEVKSFTIDSSDLFAYVMEKTHAQDVQAGAITITLSFQISDIRLVAVFPQGTAVYVGTSKISTSQLAVHVSIEHFPLPQKNYYIHPITPANASEPPKYPVHYPVRMMPYHFSYSYEMKALRVPTKFS